jgi:hypothetical protein
LAADTSGGVIVTFVYCDEVVIKWCTSRTLCAAVRDGAGVHDITLTADGFACSCGEDFCVHVAAVKSIARAASC